jgi:DNA adenine methylase
MLKYKDWRFICQPFEDTIALADENSFIYCDSPYIGRHVDYYDSWNEEHEGQLKISLLESGARFMLSTWDCNQYRQNPYINTIWGAYQKITQEHFYFVGGREENRNPMTEALLINYAEIKPAVNVAYSEQLSLAGVI